MCRKVTTVIQKATHPLGSSLESPRSSTRHAAVVKNLLTAVSVLEGDAGLQTSLLGVFPGVLDGAVSRFLSDVRRRAHRQGVTSSTRPGHFMDIRDRGRRSRADREQDAQAMVKERARERDFERLNRGA